MAEDGVAQRSFELGGEVCAGGVEGLGEDRERRVQLPAHAQALGALAGEQESGLATEGGTADGAGGVRALLGEGGQLAAQFGRVGAEQHRTVLERRPGGGE
ncbi:hypothetical protein Stsp01_55460 [Streptomyces sp. NBRC 13847]|nr:hypothetical protein Stsp01_55460 [Streptomyces sp. NBRC 13847]